MIPLRPELIEFLTAESLGRLSCSKALRTEVRETNAWRLLAAVQCPPRTTRDVLEQDAISRVRSQALRRRLAADLSRSAPNPPRPEEPDQRNNKFTDFTYFIRIEEDDELIWEGDLSAMPSCCVSNPSLGDESLVLLPSRLLDARMRSWEGMVNHLAHVPTRDEYDDSLMESLKISVVAVREADSVMIALGCFSFAQPIGDFGVNWQPYLYEARSRLYNQWSSNMKPYHFKPSLSFELFHDSNGNGDLFRIKLYMGLHDQADHLVDVSRSEFQLLLTHLAGVDHRNREAVRCALVAALDKNVDEDYM
ncbi:unnamed protein product [Pelagomonas calceolata]|uniref:Uncharacterized protein n=1 Tax=Pelagomonas calceolata TaxID=35677 RepID=A0A8J2SXI6_9STRA|nr:unnamed protein product [Pelagomonas calceolata]|mmetsp:Transcript_12175/g.37459  ORF Transcript_12175/g.37459 Transcript_12175/m.37459 type:complete len:307 (-) Transcript_12175:43-963(-)